MVPGASFDWAAVRQSQTGRVWRGDSAARHESTHRVATSVLTRVQRDEEPMFGEKQRPILTLLIVSTVKADFHVDLLGTNF